MTTTREGLTYRTGADEDAERLAEIKDAVDGGLRLTWSETVWLVAAPENRDRQLAAIVANLDAHGVDDCDRIEGLYETRKMPIALTTRVGKLCLMLKRKDATIEALQAQIAAAKGGA